MPPNQERRDGFIRTMKTDAEQLLRRDQVSFADIYAQQQRSMREQGYQLARPNTPAPRSSAAKFLGMFLFGMLLAAAAGAGYYFLVLRNPTGGGTTVTPLPEYPRPLINPQTTSVVKFRTKDRTGLIQELERFGRQNAENTFVYLPVLDAEAGKEYQLTSAQKFLETLSITPPSADFYANLTGEWNAYYYGTDLVLVFGIKNENATRGVMFSWERSLLRQFSSLLRQKDPGIVEFQDTIIRNTDARFARYGESSQSIVGYGIARKEILVIATSERALRTSIERLVVR